MDNSSIIYKCLKNTIMAILDRHKENGNTYIVAKSNKM